MNDHEPFDDDELVDLHNQIEHWQGMYAIANREAAFLRDMLRRANRQFWWMFAIACGAFALHASLMGLNARLLDEAKVARAELAEARSDRDRAEQAIAATFYEDPAERAKRGGFGVCLTPRAVGPTILHHSLCYQPPRVPFGNVPDEFFDELPTPRPWSLAAGETEAFVIVSPNDADDYDVHSFSTLREALRASEYYRQDPAGETP